MRSVKLEVMAGDQFGDVANKARSISHDLGMIVKFEFNGVMCHVNEGTHISLLHRDYRNAHVMGWSKVGPEPEKEYSRGVQFKLKENKKRLRERKEKRMAEHRKKCDKQRALISEITEGVDMKFKDKDKWDELYEINSDGGYGQAIFEYAEVWAKLIQCDLSDGVDISDCAESTQDNLHYIGITGAQFSYAVRLLYETWEYGGELRKWHNSKYGYSGEGVVNGAIINV